MGNEKLAPGAPGIPPRWTSSAKVGVGTALSRASHVWFTLSHGIFNEIYYPRVDHACIRDMGLLVTAGVDYFSEEKRHTETQLGYLADGAPAYHLVNTDRGGRYRIEKEILTDPQRDVVLQLTRFQPLEGALEDYRLYVLLAPHLNNHGTGNNAWVEDYKGADVLFAERGAYALALCCSRPFLRCSAGYVGVSDLWQDLAQHNRMTWTYTAAREGNVALGAEIDLASGAECVLALGFGRDFAEAAQSAMASLQDGFEAARADYVNAWLEWQRGLHPLDVTHRRERDLYRISSGVLRTHEDKTFPGAFTASLSIPWGFDKGDQDLGGYHLVWPRDLVQAAGAMLAIGAYEDVRGVLRYFQATQEADGHWGQNMWLDGTLYWSAIQMDETALPILLVDHMRREGALAPGELHRFWPMLRRATAYLVRNGPVTQEDRWETDPGYSPFTLAAQVAGLLAAADLAELCGERELAPYLRDTADTWNEQVERWIYIENNDYARELGIHGYYVRISAPDDPDDPANRILSPDFLSLVRFGLRAPDDPRITDSVHAIDHALKVDTPCGPLWRRYNGDNYGEQEDGSSYDGAGIGRAWPLLTGERAHYELAAGRGDRAEELASALERFANDGGMLPEQIWDSRDRPERELFFGRPSGSAMPLVWAHAEYLKLRRSLEEGRIFDQPPQTVERYLRRQTRSSRVIWRFNHKLASMPAGNLLRVETLAAAVVHFSVDGWHSVGDLTTEDSGLGMYFTDLPADKLSSGSLVAFTFFWLDAGHWEGQNYAVRVE